MASNFKISDLTQLGRAPAASDLFIVNDAAGVQQYTRSITYDDLLGGIAGGLSLQPIFLTFGVNWVGVASDYEQISGNDDLVTPRPTRSVTMPASADRAIIINSYGTSIVASPLVLAGNSTNAMAQFQYSITLTNATWRLSPDPLFKKMSLGTAYHMPAGYNYGIQDAYASKTDSSRPNVLAFSPGATVSFELQLGLRRGKKCIPGIGGGRMLIFPYNSNDEIAPVIESYLVSEDQDGVAYSLEGENPDVFDPLTDKEKQQNSSQDIKNSVGWVIDTTTRVLTYDTQITTDYPDSNYPNPLTGEETNITTLIENLRQAAYDLKYDASTNTDDYYEKLNKIVYGDEATSRPGLIGYIGFNYGFETLTEDDGTVLKTL